MNIDDLSQETLWKLYSFVNDGATDALPDAANASAREKGNATDQVPTCPQQALIACGMARELSATLLHWALSRGGIYLCSLFLQGFLSLSNV